MKTIVITGANSGIGYEMAKHLALAGNTVIAASRQKESALQAVEELNWLCAEKDSKGKVVFFDLYLTSLKSVADFAGLVKEQFSVFHMSRQERYYKTKFSLGVVNTNLFYRNSGACYRIVMVPFVYLGYLFGFFQTPAKGAQTSICLAENDHYETDRYWHHRKQLTPNPISQDRKYSAELWNWTVEQLDKVKSTSSVA